jgi:hypothetical protein
MTTPTPEQITAYLATRGWRSPAAAPTGRWTSPSGRAIRYRGEAMEDESDYHALLRSIAVCEGRSTLAVGLAIDGHAIPDEPDVDLAAIGAVLAVWRLAAEHPQSFRRLIRGFDIGLEDVAPAERGQLLARLQGDLEMLRELIGEAPASVQVLPDRLLASGRRPRRELWAADPAVSERLAQWPVPLHERLLEELDEMETETVYGLQGGNADEVLAQARELVLADWGYAEGRIVSAWVDDQLEALAGQGWATSRSLPDDESDICYRIHRDSGEKRVIVYTPAFYRPDGRPHELSDAERAMYLRLTADLVDLTGATPAAAAFPTTAAVPAQLDTEALAPETAGEAGPVR